MCTGHNRTGAPSGHSVHGKAEGARITARVSTWLAALAFVVGSVVAASLPAAAQSKGPSYEELAVRVAILARDARYAEALQVAEEFASVAKQRDGEETVVYASAIAWVGHLYQKQGRLVEADPLMERSLVIFSKVLPAGHPNIARYQPLIERNARLHGLDVALVKAVIAVESAYDPAAVSAKGALGLMQVIPDTGARYGVAADSKRTLEQKLLDPEINVRIGTAYLSDLLVLFADDASLALAAYNAGEQTVLRYANRIPPYPETRGYVTLVRQFQAFYAPPPPPAPAKPSRLRVTPSRDPS